MNHEPMARKAMLKVRYAFLIAIIAQVLTGCGIGYRTVLVSTRTNMGVDIDTQPPTMEIAISRQEGVIEPQFENGKTLSVMTSFKSDTNAIGRLFVGVGQSFSTGEAAYIMTKLYSSKDAKREHVSYPGVTLSRPPKRSSFWAFLPFVDDSPDIDPNFLAPGEVRPVTFGTQSMLGLKVDWNGSTAQYPSGLKFGYNRKELAIIPVTLSVKPGYETEIKTLEEIAARIKKSNANSDDLKKYNTLLERMIRDRVVMVDTASLLATVDLSFSSDADKDFSYLQYFATGDAANNLALRQQVRQAMLKELNPVMDITVDTSDPLSLAAQQKWTAIRNIYNVLTLPESGEKANDMAKQMDTLITKIKIPPNAKNLQKYDTAQKKLVKNTAAWTDFDNTQLRRGFDRIASLKSGLSTSIRELEKHDSSSADIKPQKALQESIFDMVFTSPVVTQLINF